MRETDKKGGPPGGVLGPAAGFAEGRRAGGPGSKFARGQGGRVGGKAPKKRGPSPAKKDKGRETRWGKRGKNFGGTLLPLGGGGRPREGGENPNGGGTGGGGKKGGRGGGPGLSFLAHAFRRGAGRRGEGPGGRNAQKKPGGEKIFFWEENCFGRKEI